jgi:hypothetical protein
MGFTEATVISVIDVKQLVSVMYVHVFSVR